MEMMKLKSFRVMNFRSVKDSGWIDIDSVTALIGTNESGKTNLLVPLWKLKPANDEPINPIADFPRTLYGDIREMEVKPNFIEALFELSENIAKQIADLTNSTQKDVQEVLIQRNLDGKYFISFPNAVVLRSIDKKEIAELLSSSHSEIQALPASKMDEGLKALILSTIQTAQDQIANITEDKVSEAVLEDIQGKLDEVDTESASKRSTIVPRFFELKDAIDGLVDTISQPVPNENKRAQELVLENLPSFVYYSNYGNLDSEIYLPHVIENMQRSNLGSKEEAKTRTLKVLFDFVHLQPREILDLGQETDPQYGRPTDQQIKVDAEKKKEREILLQSASTSLTEKFRAWWKQGEYRFRFQADGNHFRIWVSDDKRSEEIELEGRSTGLQWFLSFYLIFLVESAKAHKGAILLLDEPGLSLHALAQQDLSIFFESLSQSNQLIYTTHSPFLVDPDHLDRVKAVYTDEQGATVVSTNLRASERNPAQSKSIYPVHAALGLSVSLTLLQGCQPIIVEGQSDQIYLSFIKNYLISKALITPKKELLFIPAGGVKGITAVVPLIMGKEEDLPFVVIDSDRSGLDMYNKLKTSLYQGKTEHILAVGDICKVRNAEVEDLLPPSFLADIITRHVRSRSRLDDDEFSEYIEEGKPIIPQFEEYAQKFNIPLELGWKVEIAKKSKIAFLKKKELTGDFERSIDAWKSLFARLLPNQF